MGVHVKEYHLRCHKCNFTKYNIQTSSRLLITIKIVSKWNSKSFKYKPMVNNC